MASYAEKARTLSQTVMIKKLVKETDSKAKALYEKYLADIKVVYEEFDTAVEKITGKGEKIEK